MRLKKICLMLGIAAMVTACSKSPEELLAEQLKLGQKYLEEMDYEAAIVAYKKAIELDPKDENAYLNLSWILVQQENYEEAITILNAGLEMIPESAGILQIKERLVPTVSCSADDGSYSDPVVVELKSGKNSEIYYSVKSDDENIQDKLYEDSIELYKDGEYLLTCYALSEYGTKGEVCEREFVIELDKEKYPMNKWVQEGDTWYYYDEDGRLAVGWMDIDGERYYFHENGAMAYDAWIEDYYLGSDGAMLRDTWTPDDYYVGPDGKWDKTRDKKKELIKSLKGLDQYLYAVENYDIMGDNSIIKFGRLSVFPDAPDRGDGELIDHGDYYEVTNQIIASPVYYEWSEIMQLQPGDTITFDYWFGSKNHEIAYIVAEKDHEYRVFETTDGEQFSFEDVFDNDKFVKALVVIQEDPYRGYIAESGEVVCECETVYSGSLYLSKDCMVNVGVLDEGGLYSIKEIMESKDRDYGDYYWAFGYIDGFIEKLDENGLITLLTQITWG